MTMPFERTRAVVNTEGFLRNLSDKAVTPGLPKAIRETAKRLLRHYPSPDDLKTVNRAWDDRFVKMVVQCPFGDPDEHI